MTAGKLARVDDVIERGQPIPANVYEMSDASSVNGWGRWVRSFNGRWNWAPDLKSVGHAEAREGGCTDADMAHPESTCAPYRVEVVEVDPKPQPAEDLLSLVRRWGSEMYTLGAVDTAGGDADAARQVSKAAGALMRQIRATLLPAAPCSRCTNEPAEPSSLVLTLPEEPKTAAAVVGVESGARWEPTPVNGGRWQDVATGQVRTWVGVLEREREVTVEFAPPREPRTWDAIDDGTVEGDHLPEIVSVQRTEKSVEIWALGDGGLYERDADTVHLSLLELRTLGKVTEVLEP